MEEYLSKIESAMGNYANGIWSENDAREEIDNAVEEFIENNKTTE